MKLLFEAIVAFAVGFFIAMLASLYSTAHAWEPKDSDFHVIDKSVRHPAVRVKAWKRVSKPPAPKAPPVVHEPRCRNVVTATGSKAKSERAARLESQKAWKDEVQFEYGNKYLDFGNAIDVSYQCSSSSVPRLGGIVESTASKFLPIEDISCKMFARPCAAPVQREEDGK
jgi:hypothetical protein